MKIDESETSGAYCEGESMKVLKAQFRVAKFASLAW
jgi:hypothetical protein